MIRLGMKYKMSSHEYEMKNCEIERQDFLKILSVHGAHVTKKKMSSGEMANVIQITVEWKLHD